MFFQPAKRQICIRSRQAWLEVSGSQPLAYPSVHRQLRQAGELGVREEEFDDETAFELVTAVAEASSRSVVVRQAGKVRVG
jgi:hypothetical protein